MLIVAVLALSLSLGDKDFLECANHEKDAERLACFDAYVKAQKTEPVPLKNPGLFGFEIAIDKYLASELKEPASVTQYKITSMFECSKIIPDYDESSWPLGSTGCACWTANSKNGFGGYTGKTENFLVLQELGEGSNLWNGTSGQKVKTGAQSMTCNEANFVSRDAELVRIQID